MSLGFEFKIWGLGCRVWDIWGVEFRVWSRVQGFRVLVFGFRGRGSGLGFQV